MNLKEIIVEEISLVDKAANKKEFYILKREGDMLKGIKKILEDEDPETVEEVLEAASKIPERLQNVLKKALETVNQYVGDMPTSLQDAIKSLTTLAANYSTVEKVDDGNGEGEHKKEKTEKVKGAEPLKDGTMFKAFMTGAPRNIIEKFKFAQDPTPIEKIEEEPEPEPKHGKRTSLEFAGFSEEELKEIRKKMEGDFPSLTTALFGPQQ